MKYNYLLRCLLTCQFCGLAMFGRTSKASSTHRERRYYLCHGKDCILSARQTPCPRRSVPAECLEKAVWEHVADLLRNPAQLTSQFEQFLASTVAGTTQEQEAKQQTQTRLDRLMRADQRLLDAYQAGAITVAKLSERRTQITQQRRALEQEQEQQRRLRQQRTKAEESC
jgi:site-specific DNA recombinase